MLISWDPATIPNGSDPFNNVFKTSASSSDFACPETLSVSAVMSIRPDTIFGNRSITKRARSVLVPWPPLAGIRADETDNSGSILCVCVTSDEPVSSSLTYPSRMMPVSDFSTPKTKGETDGGLISTSPFFRPWGNVSEKAVLSARYFSTDLPTPVTLTKSSESVTLPSSIFSRVSSKNTVL